MWKTIQRRMWSYSRSIGCRNIPTEAEPPVPKRSQAISATRWSTAFRTCLCTRRFLRASELSQRVTLEVTMNTRINIRIKTAIRSINQSQSLLIKSAYFSNQTSQIKCFATSKLPLVCPINHCFTSTRCSKRKKIIAIYHWEWAIFKSEESPRKYLRSKNQPMTNAGKLTVLTRRKWCITRVLQFSRRKTRSNWPMFCHDHRVVQSSQVTWEVHKPTKIIIISSILPLTTIRIRTTFISMSTSKIQKVCIQPICLCINQELRPKLRTRSESSPAPRNLTSGASSSTTSSILTNNWVQNRWSETKSFSAKTRAASTPGKIVHLMLRRRPKWSTISVIGLRRSSKVTRKGSSKCTTKVAAGQQEPQARKCSSSSFSRRAASRIIRVCLWRRLYSLGSLWWALVRSEAQIISKTWKAGEANWKGWRRLLKTGALKSNS